MSNRTKDVLTPKNLHKFSSKPTNEILNTVSFERGYLIQSKKEKALFNHYQQHINKEQETRTIMASYSSLSSSALSSSSSSTMHSRSNSSSSNVGGGDNSFEFFGDSNSNITNTANSRRLSTSPTRRKTSALFKAMITSNNLRNCHEVEEIVAQCIQDSRSRTNQPPQSSHVCETAFNLYKNKNSGCRR